MLKVVVEALPILTFLSGGGIMWLFLFRRKFRRERNKMLEEEFMSLSLVVDKSSRQIADLSDRLREMEEVRIQLTIQINEAKKVIEDLKQENETLSALVEQLTNHEGHDQTATTGKVHKPTGKRPAGPSIRP